MRVQLAPKLISKIKKLNVRIRNNFKKKIEIFSKDPNNSELNNHKLQREWEGFSSIDVTSNWRAVYQEIDEEGEDTVAYFVELGTHGDLYEESERN